MFYKYKVTWYDSYNDEEVVEEGLTYADSYGNAANTIVENYGKDNVIDIYLYEVFNDSDSACISADELKSIFQTEDK